MEFPYNFLLLLGTPWIERNITAFKSAYFSGDHSCCATVFGLYAHLEIAFWLSQDSPLQQRCVFTPLFRLGAHLHVPPLR
jgi:hypothetical protein